MSCRLLAAFLVILFTVASYPASFSSGGPTDDPKPASGREEDRVAKAIRQLGDPTFRVREQAQRELVKLGKPAVKPLQEATQSNDPEVAKRAKVALGELYRQLAEAEVQATEITFEVMLNRIHRAETSGAWKKPDWQDLVLETGLARLLDQVKQATKRDGLRLPVTFGQVAARQAGPHTHGALCVLQGGSVAHARESIFLVDGNLRISHAQDCVIVARGAVAIAHGRGNMVLAGHYVHTSHDGDFREPRGGSLLMSGSVLDVSHSHGSVCFAPRGIRVSFATGSTFLNSPNLRISHDKGCAKIADAKLPLAPSVKEDSLSGKLKVRQIVPPDDAGQGAMVVLEQGGVEVVVRPGSEITDGRGKVVPEFAGWRLSFVEDGFALFSKGREDASVHWKKPER